MPKNNQKVERDTGLRLPSLQSLAAGLRLGGATAADAEKAAAAALERFADGGQEALARSDREIEQAIQDVQQKHPLNTSLWPRAKGK